MNQIQTFNTETRRSQLLPLDFEQHRALGSLAEQARPGLSVQSILNAQIDPASGEVFAVVAGSDGQKFDVQVKSDGVVVTPTPSAAAPQFSERISISPPGRINQATRQQWAALKQLVENAERAGLI